MKKILSFPLALCLMSVFVLGSCSDDDNDGGDNGNYSSLSVEQRKQRIETVGVDFMNKINPADHEVALKAVNSLSSLLAAEDEVVGGEPGRPDFQMKTLKSMVTINNLGAVVRLASGNMTIAEFAGLDLGTYTYNPVKEDFDYVAGTGNKVIVNYPVEGSATNNAKLEASFSNSTTVVDNVIIPSQVDMTLSVDGTEQISASVSYKGQLDNQNDHAIITIAGKYVAEATVSAKDGAANCSATLKVGNDVLISATGNISGSFQIPDVDASESQVENEAKKINSAKVDINIMGQLAITGTANPGAIIKFEDDFDGTGNEKADTEALVVVYNANMDINLMDLSNNTKLATGEMYTYEDKYCYPEWADGGYTGKEICSYYYDEALGLRFDDDTLVDFEDFIDDKSGFGDLIDAFNRLSQAYESYIQ